MFAAKPAAYRFYMLQSQTVSAATLELLEGLMAIPVLGSFALVGGTNLSLRLGHRVSLDLDMFTNTEFDSNDLLPVLSRIYPDIIIGTQKKTSLQGWINEIKVDIVLHNYPYIRPIEIIDGIRLGVVKK